MNAQEMLIHLTEKQIDRLFEVARKLPADKLGWKPSPDSRSALCQLQEVATALPVFWPMFTERKMEWDPNKMAQWMSDRQKLTTLDELESVAKKNTAMLFEFIRGLDEADLDAKVEMPFPGEFKLADIVSYHYWNAGYHEGQITYISNMLKA